MKFYDFFSGIGGFRLGLERAGHKGVWACEVDDFCRKIYAQHFGHLPQGKDINDVKAEEIPGAEIWCGGFPCQDNSVAGQRRGFRGARSSVFWPWLWLIRQVRPEWLLIENVPGLYSVGEGLDFGLILRRLGDVGYGLSWRSLDAQFFGLAQRRKRVFIVGCFGKPCPPEILFERESLQRNPPAKREAGSGVAHCLTKRTHKGGDPTTDQYVVAPTLNIKGGRAATGGLGNEAQFCIASPFSPTGHEGDTCVDARGISNCIPSQGGNNGGGGGQIIYSFDWQQGGNPSKNKTQSLSTTRTPAIITPPPDPNGMREVAGLPGRMDTPDSPRYKALGNAVAVPVIEWIGRRLPK